MTKADGNNPGSDSLYITATEARSGKSAISLGVMEMLSRKVGRVGFFRPLISVDPASGDLDKDIRLLSSHFNLNTPYEMMYGYTAAEALDLFSSGKEAEILEGVIKKYQDLKTVSDFVLCEGTDYVAATAAFELDVNAEISRNLGCPVLLVARAPFVKCSIVDLFL